MVEERRPRLTSLVGAGAARQDERGWRILRVDATVQLGAVAAGLYLEMGDRDADSQAVSQIGSKACIGPRCEPIALALPSIIPHRPATLARLPYRCA